MTDLGAIRAQLVAAIATIDAMADEQPDPWIDLDGAVECVPVPRETLARWAREGRLRAVTAERGRLVFRRSWLDEALLAAPYTPRAAEQSDTADDDDLAGTGLRVVR